MYGPVGQTSSSVAPKRPNGLIALYALVIAVGILEVAMGIVTAIAAIGVYDFRPRYPPNIAIGFISAACALWTWIWAAVLLAYCKKPKAHSPLVRLRIHFWSSLLSAVVWLALAIALTTEITHSCEDLSDDSTVIESCAANAVSMSLAYILFILSLSAAFISGLAARGRGGLDVRVDAP
ncbi:hypothetical protein CYLTODRAFT_179526 [Cylindrobasidium torrendii FP15055 ss-10]|uniref:MARVEL domain-containing protein n=1 Tax=Cylindrobasidium torrendii FP15055 ss-10 TaxID=1314674 RepID=A0A0D7BLU2_9AGAR|nr:hypothetical protein CYLTODRAFT_179526 [Cylindrobasidium torrendii FP15055 ss-10]